MQLDSLDFCFNCAMTSMYNRSDRYKAFAYCFLLYMKSVNKSLIQGSLKEKVFELWFNKKIFEDWDLPFFIKEKEDANSYFFLKPIVSEFILNNMKSLSYKYSFEFENGNLKVSCLLK